MSFSAQLEHLLDSWSSWQASIDRRPKVIGRLSNGLVSQCWHVQSGNQNFVVRFSSHTIEEINCRWDEELQAAELAAGLGIAPGVVYASNQHKATVLNWAGEPATAVQLGNEETLHKLATALRLLHQTPAKLNTPGYEETLTLYAKRIPEQRSAILSPDVLDYARYLDDQYKHLVFCHHDLSLGNILLLNNRVQFVDWEYARIGHALFDLASIVDSAKLDEDQYRFLFDQYGAPIHFIDEVPPMLALIEHLAKLWEPALAH